MNEWEASLDDFDQRQSNFTKETFKGKPSKNGMTAGTGKEMYWVGIVQYDPDYSDRSRIATSLGVESGVKNDDEADE